MEEDKNIRKSIISSEDIVEEILHYLPMESLARFKALSKKWSSTIESTYFSHNRLVRLGLPTPNTKLLVIHQPSSNLIEDSNSTTFVLDTFSRDNNGEICLSSSSSHTFPDNPIEESQDQTIQVLGSCDGLVLVRIHKDFMYIHLINPTTREHRTLSPEPSQWSTEYMYITKETTIPTTGELSPSILQLQGELWNMKHFAAGFGKDIVTRSYKVILMYSPSENYFRSFRIKVLSIDNGEQRDVDFYSLYHYRIRNEQTSVYANGLLFWLTDCCWKRQKHSQLLAIDLHTEKFRWILLPNFYSNYSLSMQMWSLNDCVCLSNVLQCPELDVWSLQQEVPNQKWEKMYSFNILNIDQLDAKYWMLGLTGTGFRGIGENRDHVLCDKRRTTILYSPTMVSPLNLLQDVILFDVM